MKEIFQVYLNRLIDLSSRNKSLYLPKIVPSQMIDLNDFGFLNDHSAFGYIQQLLSRKKRIPLIATADARMKAVNVLSQRLKRLQHQIQLTENETGEKSLYVGWPFVEGKLLNGQLIRCPLLFFPVSLQASNGKWEMVGEDMQAPIFNPAFLLVYAHAYGHQLSENWSTFGEEDLPKDATAFRTALYQFLSKELTINFTRELFEDQIINFPESAKSLDDDKLELGKLKLISYAVLGQFSQKTSFLIEDYQGLIKDSSEGEMETFLSNTYAKIEENFIPREDHLYTVFPTDASQERVIRAVRTGQSCVVQGPPGTGKSQLIANLVMDYISRGKRVLVVSQKKAALDVVYKRLDDKGFGNFLGLVHDIKSDRKLLFKKILHQIESIEEYKQYNRSLDAIQLERRFSQLARLIDQHGEYFEEYRQALYNSEDCGKPIKELYMFASREDDFFEMNSYLKAFTWDKVPDFLRDFGVYHAYFIKYQQSNSFWLHRQDFSSFDSSAYYRLKESIEAIDAKVAAAQEIFQLEDQEILSFFSLYPQKNKLKELLQYLDNEEARSVFWGSLHVNPQEIDLLWLENKFLTVKKLLEEDIEWHSPDEQVEHFHFLAIQFESKNESWLKFPSLLWDRKYWEPIYELLNKNGWNNDARGRKKLISALENRLNFNHQYTLLSSKPWLRLPEKPLDFQAFNHVSIIHLQGLKGRIAFEELERQLSIFKGLSLIPDALFAWLEKSYSFFMSLENEWNGWEVYLSNIQIQHLLNGIVTGGNERIKNELVQTFEDLVAFDRLKKQLSLPHQEVIEKIISSDPDAGIEALKQKFLIGLQRSWIDYLEAKYPILKEINGPQTEIFHEDFIQAVKEKWQVSSNIASLRLREHVVKDLAYNRLNNLITYRELKHQVSKQKKIWSIRQVTEKHKDEIFQLLPCWLASPETVSAIFGREQAFDLVIFDEASQCYVEKGLPAMLRGRQVVIAGDSQQLPPFDLYQVRLETEDEEIALSTDSLLDFASNYFNSFILESHYRSAQLPLIHFSNERFYQNKLSMLTAFDLANKKQNPFEFVLVNGVWENQMNKEEAYAVLEKIKVIQSQEAYQSIGVITFNFFQMQLIQDLLDEDSEIKKQNLYVKNIENVQGDEYDHVIFSIGYAKNKGGKLIANFGLLSKRGGKNRLNVAISRAKKKVTLISSIVPEDFNSTQIENEGIFLLRDYLSFVRQLSAGEEIVLKDNLSKEYLSEWLVREKLLNQYPGQLKRYEQSHWMDLVKMIHGHYQAAILTDDFRFYEAASAKEFMVYQALQLREKGWPFQYFYSREYWKGHSPLSIV